MNLLDSLKDERFILGAEINSTPASHTRLSMANRARLGLQIVSPWGSVNKLRIEVSPQITVADLISQIQKDMGLENFTITIEEQVPGSDWGKDLIKGTLAENEVRNRNFHLPIFRRLP